MKLLTLVINGKRQRLKIDPETPLLWVLRDELGLLGTKFGCGVGACGACTVLVDGDPVRSCVTAVSEVSGKAVTTIEGLGEEVGRSLRQAWIDEEVPQCGYCQPGQLLTAFALLKAHAEPSDGQIDEAMAGNLCRCGTYQRIRRAIRRAAKEVSHGSHR